MALCGACDAQLHCNVHMHRRQVQQQDHWQELPYTAPGNAGNWPLARQDGHAGWDLSQCCIWWAAYAYKAVGSCAWFCGPARWPHGASQRGAPPVLVVGYCLQATSSSSRPAAPQRAVLETLLRIPWTSRTSTTSQQVRLALFGVHARVSK